MAVPAGAMPESSFSFNSRVSAKVSWLQSVAWMETSESVQLRVSATLPAFWASIVTSSVNRPNGVIYDALRLEITNQSADHSATGWNDYEFLYGNTQCLPASQWP